MQGAQFHPCLGKVSHATRCSPKEKKEKQIAGFAWLYGIWAPRLICLMLYVITWLVSRIPGSDVASSVMEASPFFWVAVNSVPSPDYQEGHLPGCASLLSRDTNLSWSCTAQGEDPRGRPSWMPLRQPVILLVDPGSSLFIYFLSAWSPSWDTRTLFISSLFWVFWPLFLPSI